jgi:hypothetical protein
MLVMQVLLYTYYVSSCLALCFLQGCGYAWILAELLQMLCVG